MELPEIIAALNAAIGDDKTKAKDAARLLRSDAKPVAQLLINVGAGQKAGDVDGKLKALEGERDAAITERDEIRTEFDEFKAKTPDAAAIAESERKKWEPKVTKATERADQATTALHSERKKLAVARFVSLLSTPDDSGTRIEPQWAEKVVAAELNDRFVIKDDGTLGVLQPGETTEYDADTLEKKIAALAKDARKTVASTYVLTGSDSGAGTRGGHGGGTALKTQEQIKQEKQRDSAFSGF